MPHDLSTILVGLLAGNLSAAIEFEALVNEGRLSPQEIIRIFETFHHKHYQNKAYPLWALAKLKRYLKQDITQIIPLLDAAAEVGNPFAMCDRALLYIAEPVFNVDEVFQAKIFFRSALDQGIYKAAYGLGRMYELGMIDDERFECNFLKAKYYYKVAIQHKDVESAFNLAALYEKGYLEKIAGRANYAEAQKYYLFAVQHRHIEAAYRLAELYAQGLIDKIDDQPNYAEAKKYYEIAIEEKHVLAAHKLGYLYHMGKLAGGPNFELAKKYYDLATALGSERSPNNLGILYADGKIGKINDKADYQQARAFYEMAIVRGCALAYYNLGLAYEDNEDYFAAKNCYEKAIDHGISHGARVLGLLYAEGRITNGPDYIQARKYYELAIAWGDKLSIVNLGKLYTKGINGIPDYIQAKKYFEMAIAKNDKSGNYYLGKLYERGKVNDKVDYNVAREHYELALSEYGHAAYRLGQLYELGHISGTPDYEKAGKYYEIASEKGDKEAAYCLGCLYEKVLLRSTEASNKELAIKYYMIAAKRWHANAAYRMGNLFEKDFEWSRARMAYEFGAKLKNSDCISRLAIFYFNHYFSEISYKNSLLLAIEYAEEAVSLGKKECYQILASIYIDLAVNNLPLSMHYYQKFISFKIKQGVFDHEIFQSAEAICGILKKLKTQDHHDVAKLESEWKQFFNEHFNASQRDKKNNSLLQFSIIHCYYDFAYYLIEMGVSLNNINNDNLTALELCGKYNAAHLACFLLKQKNIKIRLTAFFTPLAASLAWKNGNYDTAEAIRLAYDQKQIDQYFEKQDQMLERQVSLMETRYNQFRMK